MKNLAVRIVALFVLLNCSSAGGAKIPGGMPEARSAAVGATGPGNKIFSPAPESSNYFAEATANGRFFWPNDRGPLKVFIDDGGKTRGYRDEFRKILADAFTNWCHVTGDILQWTECNDANDANIRCEWVASRESLGADAAYGEAGTTSVHGIENGKNFELDRVKVILLTQAASSDGSVQPFSDSQMRSLALHEVGHALGLQGHSSDGADVMFGAAVADDISARDMQTIRMLYRGQHRSASAPKAESRAHNAPVRSEIASTPANDSESMKKSEEPSDAVLEKAKRELEQKPDSMEARIRVSKLLSAMGTRAEKTNDTLTAELRFKAAYDIWREPDAQDCDEKIRAVEAFGIFLAKQKRPGEAEPLLADCLRKLASSMSCDSERIAADAVALARCYRALGEKDDARAVELKYHVKVQR